MASPLNNAVEFLRAFGFFDVVVPFLLVFTIVFGVLEKTKLFGAEKDDKGNEVPKKNLNSMVAFSIAFFVIAATKVVEIIKLSIPQIMLVLVVIIALMLLVGTFVGEGIQNFGKEFKGWTKFFILVVFIAVVVIFLNIFGLLGATGSSIKTLLGGPIGGSILLLLISVGAIGFVMSGRNRPAGDSKK